MLLDSGMDVGLALNALKEQAHNRALRRFISDLSIDINSGSALWRALDEIKMFSPQVISLLRVGEQSGQLPQNIRVVAGAQEKNREFRSKITSALIYPAFVLTLAAIIAIGVAWFILPNLSRVFSSLNIELPLITRLLIQLGSFLAESGHIAVPVAITGIIATAYIVFVFRPTRFIGQTMIFHTPGIGRLVKEIELARMGFMMHSLLFAGIPIDAALEVVSGAATLRPYKKFYMRIQRHIYHGLSFQQAFAHEKATRRLLLGNTQYLLIAAEGSGDLPNAFQRIGKTYDLNSENSTKNFATMIEPFMLVFVWVGVLTVALAVILPVYGLIGGINSPGTATPTPAPAPELQEADVEIVIPPVEEPELPVETEPEEPPPRPELEINATPTGTLNVRAEPSLAGAIIDTVTPASRFYWLEQRDDWYLIELDETRTGWVSGTYVTEVTESEV